MPSSKRSQSEVSSLDDDSPQELPSGTVTLRISQKELLSLQIRVLLEHAEEVPISNDVVEELMQSLPVEDEENEANEDGDNNHEEDEDMDDVEIIAKDGEVSLNSVLNPDNAGWSSDCLSRSNSL